MLNACIFLQLALKLKALKRQVDEGEAEVERLEGSKRKAIRDMEEQMEQKDALQSRVTALENELKYVLRFVMLFIFRPTEGSVCLFELKRTKPHAVNVIIR